MYSEGLSEIILGKALGEKRKKVRFVILAVPILEDGR